MSTRLGRSTPLLVIAGFVLLVLGLLLRDAAHRPDPAPAGADPRPDRSRDVGPDPAADAPAETPGTPEPAAPADPEPRARFRFRILDAGSGRPLVGVRVAPEAGFDGGEIEEAPALHGAPGLSDPDGEASFVLEAGRGPSCRFVAGRPGRLLVRGWARSGRVTEVRLPEGTLLPGRVIRAGSGAGVEGAVVRAWRASDAEETCRSATTDRDGRFTLEAVPPGETVVVYACVPGFFPASVRRAFTDPAEPLELVAGAGGTVEGRVTDPDGGVAAGVAVWLLRPDFPIPPRRPGGHWIFEGGYRHLLEFALARTVTDETGLYRFVGVPVGQDRVAVVKLSDHMEIASAPFRIERDGELVSCDVALPRPARVTIEARDDRGELVPPVQVDFLSPRLWFDARNAGVTDESEHRLLLEVPPGDWRLRAWLPGAEPVEREIALAPGEERTVVFEAAPGAVLEGIVLDPEGRPVDFAQLTLREPTRFANTDETGRFRITGLPTDRGLSLKVEGGFDMNTERPRPLAPVEIEDVRAGGEPIRIVLPYGGRIRGRIAGVPPGTALSGSLFTRKDHSSFTLRVDEGGAFVLDAPRPGLPFLLRIEHADRAPLVVEGAPLALGEDADLGELAFDAGHVLDGRVTGPDGDPVAGAEVVLLEPWFGRKAVTDAEGRFRLDRLPARPIWTRVLAKGRPAWFVVLDPPDRTPSPSIRIGRGGVLAAEVRDAAGTPAAGGSLRVVRDVEHPLVGNLDLLSDFLALGPDGCRRVELQPGRYRVRTWQADREESALETIEIPEGGERALRLDLAPLR